MDKEQTDSGKKSTEAISRREILAKYGTYTAPLVISMLCPQQAYGHTTSDAYSTSSACSADPSGGNMHDPSRTGHCMWGGANAGGTTAHDITAPGT